MNQRYIDVDMMCQFSLRDLINGRWTFTFCGPTTCLLPLRQLLATKHVREAWTAC